MDVVYHEKQRRQLCALHTLNNLFQDRNAFTKQQLDDIACELDSNFFNAHKSIIGLGNYDIAVIEKALASRNYSYKWFNKNKKFRDLRLENIFGFILNIPNPTSLWKTIMTLGHVSTRHWIAIRLINDIYVNLDSKLPEPETIGDGEELEEFIMKYLSNNSEALIVVHNDVDQNGLWKTDNY